LKVIEWKQASVTNHFEISPFNSFDPAPPMAKGNIHSWATDLLDPSLSGTVYAIQGNVLLEKFE